MRSIANGHQAVHTGYLDDFSLKQGQRTVCLIVSGALRFAIAVAMSVAFAAAPFFAQAQQMFPVKPIRLVASTTAGSQPDMLARMIAHKMSEHWGQAVVIENRSGAGGMLAASMVARATPDGHTLLYALPNFAISAVLQPSLPYDPFKDFAGATQIGISTNVLVVSPSLGVKSVKDFIALAKSQPGKLIFASSATGSADTSRQVRPREPGWSPAAARQTTSRAAGSSNRRCSATSRTR